MMHTRFAAVLVLGALFGLTGCSEPTSVGANVGPDSLVGGAPITYEVPPETLSTERSPSITGFESTGAAGPTGQSWRFLTGVVNDPVGGTVKATGHLDFLGAQEPAESIQSAVADSLDAELRLRPTYLHGDTASTLNVEVYSLALEADMSRAPADTVFPAESQPIGSYSITPTDSLVTLSLPTSWIDDHLAALKDSSAFDNKITGFKFVATDQATSSDRRIVAGFEFSSSTLRLSSSTDTTDFNPLKVHTEITRVSPPNPPPNRILLQDGIGTQLSMAWDFNAPPLDSLRTGALNKAAVTVPVDTVALEESLQNASASFARPLPTGYRLLARRTTDAPGCGRLGLFSPPEAGRACALPTVPNWAPQAARLEGDAAFRIFEQAFTETPLFESYQTEIAFLRNTGAQAQRTIGRGLPSTVPVLVPRLTGNAEDGPRATLVVTPL